MSERLRRTNVPDLRPGDFIVKPRFLSVYHEDKEGWASLNPTCGTRFEVVAVTPRKLTARRLEDGEVVSQSFNRLVSVLKVVA